MKHPIFLRCKAVIKWQVFVFLKMGRRQSCMKQDLSTWQDVNKLSITEGERTRK